MSGSGSEAEAKSTGPSGRTIIWWSAGMFLALAMAGAFCWLVLGPCLRVRAAIKDCSSGEQAVERLGGAERAAGKLSLYLRLPGWAAPDQDVAVRLLGFCGKSGLAVLTRQLDDRNPTTRAAAARALGNLGVAAIPAITKALRDQDPDVRISALMALGGIRPPPPAAAEALIPALGDADPDVRFQAVHEAGLMGETAVSAIPALIPLLKDSGRARVESAIFIEHVVSADLSTIRCSAAQALGDISPQKARRELCELLTDEDANMRAVAALALGRLGRYADDVSALLGILAKALGDPEAKVRAAAAKALGNLGPEKKILELTKVLSPEDPKVSFAAAQALGYIGPDAAAAVPALTGLLADKLPPWLRAEAAHTLGRIGPAAKAAIPDLEQCARVGNDPKLRQAAVEALKKIRGEEAKP